jgi:hypothetical protein
MSDPEVYQSSGDSVVRSNGLRAIYKTATIVPPPTEVRRFGVERAS